MATIKELEAELAKSRSINKRLSSENIKLASLLAEVEPALAQANSQVEELRLAVDDLTSQKVSAEQNFDQAIKMRDNADSAYRKEYKKAEDALKDLRYEKSRRISAENKAFDLEQRLLQVANNEYEPSEVQDLMEGLRIDRHGEIA